MRTLLPSIIAIGILTVAGQQAATAANLEDVTVVVQMPTSRITGRDTATGATTYEVTATARLQYDPILLTTNSGRALLDAKVADVARRLCMADALDLITDDGSCVQKTIRRTKMQLDAATAQLNARLVPGDSRQGG